MYREYRTGRNPKSLTNEQTAYDRHQAAMLAMKPRIDNVTPRKPDVGGASKRHYLQEGEQLKCWPTLLHSSSSRAIEVGRSFACFFERTDNNNAHRHLLQSASPRSSERTSSCCRRCTRSWRRGRAVRGAGRLRWAPASPRPSLRAR